MGDLTPKLKGRLTLNPFKHLDMGGFLCFLFFGIGWAKPVAINPLNFKKYKTGMRIVSVAGVLSNVLLGLVCAILYAILAATVGFASAGMLILQQILIEFMIVNSYLAVFNFLPIYPLDGFNFVSSFLKPDNKFISYSLKNGLKIVLVVLLVSLLIEMFFGIDIVGMLFSSIYNWVYRPIANLGV